MFVDFIIPTYNRVKPLRSMLSSLVAQTDGDWRATVVVDNPEGYEMLDVAKSFNDDRIKVVFMNKRHNDWGHTPRDLGKQMSTCEYIIMTGDDNYYTPNFVAELKKAVIGMNPGMVYWDMIHSHYDYSYFKCSPSTGQIDMGAFATKRDLAQQIPLGTEYAADGTFVENFKHTFPNEQIKKINKVLFVHN